MIAAIFGLVGVLVGGVVTGVVTAVIEARRDARSLQAAARLLLIDVIDAQTTYQDCLKAVTWSSYPSRLLPLDQWEEWKGLISAHVPSSADWRVVIAPFMDIRHNNDLANRHGENDPMLAVSRGGMEKAVLRVEEALPVLGRYVRGEHFLRKRLALKLRLIPRHRPPLLAENEVRD